jgi:heterodisulfide reductase subunit C
MGDLKRAAVVERTIWDRRSPLFYQTFMDTVRRYGRVREAELMSRYFLSVRNPAVPMKFMPLGLKLMMKGKLSFKFPNFFGKGRLDKIYRKAQAVEELNATVSH